ncbi:unnamed protein product [Prorocentrum cordatum]|uniref:Uncharacterized protein n=1 Tax=Prorocentrum cordatum TaxID=2364126 RepID=A0ABN9WQR0_9DINO|nr:unnamed protein product [Polarella glacialis]
MAAIAQTSDAQMKAALAAELAKVEVQPPQHVASPADEVRRTDAAWRDAEVKHDQAAKAVQRFRGQLEQAEAKEQLAARSLAQAATATSQAAQAIAKADGVLITPDNVDGDDKGPRSLFHLSWDQELFANIDQLEHEQSEKENLAQLERDLVSTKDTWKSKEEEVQAWLRRAAELKASIEERLGKKRRNNDDQAVPGGDGQSSAVTGHAAAPTATAAAAGEEPSTEQKASQAAADEQQASKVEAEAERLSRAKFAALNANLQMREGKGKNGSTAGATLGKGVGAQPQSQAPRPGKEGPNPESKSSRARAARLLAAREIAAERDEVHSRLYGGVLAAIGPQKIRGPSRSSRLATLSALSPSRIQCPVWKSATTRQLYHPKDIVDFKSGKWHSKWAPPISDPGEALGNALETIRQATKGSAAQVKRDMIECLVTTARQLKVQCLGVDLGAGSISTTLGAACGARVRGRCLTTLLELEAASLDPAQRFITGTSRQWLTNWRRHPEARPGIIRAGDKVRLKLEAIPHAQRSHSLAALRPNLLRGEEPAAPDPAPPGPGAPGGGHPAFAWAEAKVVTRRTAVESQLYEDLLRQSPEQIKRAKQVADKCRADLDRKLLAAADRKGASRQVRSGSAPALGGCAELDRSTGPPRTPDAPSGQPGGAVAKLGAAMDQDTFLEHAVYNGMLPLAALAERPTVQLRGGTWRCKNIAACVPAGSRADRPQSQGTQSEEGSFDTLAYHSALGLFDLH